MDDTPYIHVAGSGPPSAIPADALLEEAARLHAMPAFPAAVRDYTAGLARFRASSRLVNKLSAHEARFRLVGYLLHLSAVNRSAGGDGGIGYGQLYELVRRRDEVSPRVLKTTLALLSFLGFVETSRSASDRRLKFYCPTARMLAFAKHWFSHAASALDVLEPELQRSRLLHEDAAFLNRLLVSGGQDHADGPPPADRMPEFIGFFGGREGAAAVTAALTLADLEGVPAPSRSALARQFGLSRSQVSEVIAEGVRVGFLALGEHSTPLVLPHLAESYRRWISIELAFYARHMRAA